MELLDWVDIEKLNWNYLSYNANAIELFKKIKIKLIGIIYLKILILTQLNY